MPDRWTANKQRFTWVFIICKFCRIIYKSNCNRLRNKTNLFLQLWFSYNNWHRFCLATRLRINVKRILFVWCWKIFCAQLASVFVKRAATPSLHFPVERLRVRSTYTKWIAVALLGQKCSPRMKRKEVKCRLQPVANCRHPKWCKNVH